MQTTTVDQTGTTYTAVEGTYAFVFKHGSRWGCAQDNGPDGFAWIGEWARTKRDAVAYAEAHYCLPTLAADRVLEVRRVALEAKAAQDAYYTAPGFNHARYAELVDAKKGAYSRWDWAAHELDAEALAIYNAAVDAESTAAQDDDAATYCRHNNHYCPGCSCECHTTPESTPEPELPYVCGRCHTGLTFEYAEQFGPDDALLCEVCLSAETKLVEGAACDQCGTVSCTNIMGPTGTLCQVCEHLATNPVPEPPTSAALPLPTSMWMTQAQAEQAGAQINAYLATRGPLALNGCPDTADVFGLVSVEPTTRYSVRRGQWALQGNFVGGGHTNMTDLDLSLIAQAIQQPEPPAPTLCTTCHEYSDPAWDRAAIEPQLPSVSTPAMRYTSVYCHTCKQVNRATGHLLGMERPYQHCCVALCPAILPTEQMVLDRGYYCPEHAPAPEPSYPAVVAQAGAAGYAEVQTAAGWLPLETWRPYGGTSEWRGRFDAETATITDLAPGGQVAGRWPLRPPTCTTCQHGQDEHASSTRYSWDGLGACYAEVSTDPPRCCACSAFTTTPPTCTHCEQAPATDSGLCTPCATLPEPVTIPPTCQHGYSRSACLRCCPTCGVLAPTCYCTQLAARHLPVIAGGSVDCDTLDRHAVRELDLYAENTSELYGQFQSIIANLRRKIARGTYDAALAPKLWRYWYDAAAKRYQTDVCPMRFPPAVRQACAEQRAADEYQKIINGEYDPPAEHVEVCHACHAAPATRRDPCNTARQLCHSCAITESNCRGW